MSYSEPPCLHCSDLNTADLKSARGSRAADRQAMVITAQSGRDGPKEVADCLMMEAWNYGEVNLSNGSWGQFFFLQSDKRSI